MFSRQADKRGAIPLVAFHRGVQELIAAGPTLDPAEARKVPAIAESAFKLIDTDHSGVVLPAELVAGMKELCLGEDRDHRGDTMPGARGDTRESFADLDENGDPIALSEHLYQEAEAYDEDGEYPPAEAYESCAAVCSEQGRAGRTAGHASPHSTRWRLPGPSPY